MSAMSITGPNGTFPPRRDLSSDREYFFVSADIFSIIAFLDSALHSKAFLLDPFSSGNLASSF